MQKSFLPTLIECTYTRSDLLYRFSLLKEFLEFVFFVEQKNDVTKDLLLKFAQKSGKSDEDVAFLKRIDLSVFTKDSFYSALETLSEESKHIETMSLVLPVVLSDEALGRIGVWARQTIKRDILLEVDIDPTIVTGCQLVWKNILHDFSFNHYVQKQAKELHNRIKLSSAANGEF